MTVTGGNADLQGGGIANSGTLTLVHVTITGNNAAEIASGILNTGSVIMQRSTVTANQNLDVSGYGIENDGSMTIDESVVSRQSEGGISNTGNLSVTRSTISNNHAMPEPGGLENAGTANIAFSTFANNSAGNTSGGGIGNWGSVTIVASTFAGNVGDEGGGGIANFGSVTLAASIVAGNTDTSGLPDDCAGAFTSAGYNLLGEELRLSYDRYRPANDQSPDPEAARQLRRPDPNGATRSGEPDRERNPDRRGRRSVSLVGDGGSARDGSPAGRRMRRRIGRAQPVSDRAALVSCDAPGTIRTCDTQIRSLLLYPLSYGRGRNGSIKGDRWDSNPRPPGPQPGATTS